MQLLQEQIIALAPRHCLHGCRYLGFVGNKILTTHKDVGNADFAWSKNQPFILTSPLFAMTATDGGNAIFAGAKNCPWHRVIPFILNIAAPCHPWHRVIPFILNIKNPPEAGSFSFVAGKFKRLFRDEHYARLR